MRRVVVKMSKARFSVSCMVLKAGFTVPLAGDIESAALDRFAIDVTVLQHDVVFLTVGFDLL